MSGAVFIPDGIPQDISRTPRHMPPQVDGEHLFTIEQHSRVTNLNPEDGTFHLDAENLIAVIGPQCYWCLATTDDGSPCPGLPG